jgi:hypothetical protein
MKAINTLINKRAELTVLCASSPAITINKVAYALYKEFLKQDRAQRLILNKKLQDIAERGFYNILSKERPYDCYDASYALYQFTSLEEEEQYFNDLCGWEWELKFEYLSHDEAEQAREQINNEQIVII